MTCKTQYNRKTLLETKYLSRHLAAAIPLRSADTHLKKTIELQHATVKHIALMRQFQCTSTSTHANYHSHSIATHYSTTHRFDAPVPLHKVCQHMQNTKARHQQRREKSHGTRSYNKRAFRARFHSKAATPKTVARVSQLFSATEPRLPPKTHCFVQIQTLKSHTWCSSSNAICQEWLAKHNTIARHYWRPSTFQDTLPQPFHCDLQTHTWKRQ